MILGLASCLLQSVSLAEKVLANIGLTAIEQLIYAIHDGNMNEADIANHIATAFSSLTPQEAQILVDIGKEIAQTQMGNFIGSGRLISMHSNDIAGSGCGTATRCEFYVTAETRMVGWFWPFRREVFDSYTIWGTCKYECCECRRVKCHCGTDAVFTVSAKGTNSPFTIDGAIDIGYESFSP